MSCHFSSPQVTPPSNSGRKTQSVTFKLRESQRADIPGAVLRFLQSHGVSGDGNVQAVVGAIRAQLAATAPAGDEVLVSLPLDVVPPGSLHMVTELVVEVEGGAKPCCVAEAVSRAIFAGGA